MRLGALFDSQRSACKSAVIVLCRAESYRHLQSRAMPKEVVDKELHTSRGIMSRVPGARGLCTPRMPRGVVMRKSGYEVLRRHLRRRARRIHFVSVLFAGCVFLFTSLPDLVQYCRHPGRVLVDEVELRERRREYGRLESKRRLCRLEIEDHSPTGIDPDTSSCGPKPTLDFFRDPTPKEVADQLLNPQRQWRMLWPSLVAWSGVWLAFASGAALRGARGGLDEPREGPDPSRE